MENFKNLNDRVIKWANEKGILKKATPLTQIKKTIEEVEETHLAIMQQQIGVDTYTTQKGNLAFVDDEIKDGFGDVLVTVLIGCYMQDLNPLDCLETALNVIEKRTGKMINGTFEKDK